MLRHMPVRYDTPLCSVVTGFRTIIEAGRESMRFLKRLQEPDAPADFWSWWSDARDRIGLGIAGGGFDNRLISEISRAVATIDPAMAWQFAPGRQAQHALCLSPE